MKASRTLPLLLEIGCEEIPARFLEEAERSLRERAVAALEEARLLPVIAPRSSESEASRRGAPAEPADSGFGTRDSRAVRSYSTPRRLVVWVPALLERQPDQEVEVVGPSVKVSFDAEGQPTRAAESFAAKHGASLRELRRVSTERGDYLALSKKNPGRPVWHLLPEILPSVIRGVSSPKSMYWTAKADPRFVRPIRWLLALLGEGREARVVPFEFAGVKSGDHTYGHRATGEGPVRVESFNDYAKKLRGLQVEIDRETRREMVRAESKALLEKWGAGIVQDNWLEDWVVNSCEWPTPLVGSFDDRYLALPREILVTVMRDHQKYFAIEDRERHLEARFVAVLNLDGDPKGLIRAGHERVLSARFSDAEFFWNADRKVPLEKRRDLLSGVTYQEKLGTYADKARRMKAIARELCSDLERSGMLAPPDTERTLRAVEMAKCDLTTHMVREFPELQGIAGGLYAQAAGEATEVYEAIYDQYLPPGLEGRCPRRVVGAVVSLSDKIDNLAAGFAVGEEPTGSSDLFAMRRQGNAIFRVLLEFSMGMRLKPLLEHALGALDVQWQKPQTEVFASLLDFMVDRLRYYLEAARGFRYDTVRAVLAAGWDPALEALRRAKALEALRDKPDFEALSVAAKRIRNILTKSARASDWTPGGVDPNLLQPGAEAELYEAFVAKRDVVGEVLRARDYKAALEAISDLRPYVDRFFDKVLVMAEEASLRQNRLRLLGKLDELFSSLAHFAEIAAAPANVDASTMRQ